MTEEPNHGEEENEDSEDNAPERGGQSDPAPDNEEGEGDQTDEARVRHAQESLEEFDFK